MDTNLDKKDTTHTLASRGTRIEDEEKLKMKKGDQEFG